MLQLLVILLLVLVLLPHLFVNILVFSISTSIRQVSTHLLPSSLRR